MNILQNVQGAVQVGNYPDPVANSALLVQQLGCKRRGGRQDR